VVESRCPVEMIAAVLVVDLFNVDVPLKASYWN
jgi:hypothetical protein